MRSKIERALEVALTAHENQYDDDGITPYIIHPIFVASNFRYDETSYCAAILHDVVEDSDKYTIEIIREIFGSEISEIVNLLTKVKGESYPDFLTRIKDSGNERAIEIKKADIEDNIQRCKRIHDALKRNYLLKKYHGSIDILY